MYQKLNIFEGEKTAAYPILSFFRPFDVDSDPRIGSSLISEWALDTYAYARTSWGTRFNVHQMSSPREESPEQSWCVHLWCCQSEIEVPIGVFCR